MAEAVQTGSVGGQSGSPADQAKEKASEVAGQAQEKAGQAAQQAKSTVRDQVDQRSTQAGQQITSQASDVRAVADELRKQGKDGPAKVAEQAAERAEKVGNWMTESDGDRILHDVEDFGRRKPWALALGGLALGFAASRLLKASSEERYRSSYGSGAHAAAPTAAPRRRPIRPQRACPRAPLSAGRATALGPVAMAGRSQRQDLRDRPTGELLRELSNQTTTLVRQEIELAKAELSEKGKRQAPAPGCSVAPGSPASSPSPR